MLLRHSLAGLTDTAPSRGSKNRECVCCAKQMGVMVGVLLGPGGLTLGRDIKGTPGLVLFCLLLCVEVHRHVHIGLTHQAVHLRYGYISVHVPQHRHLEIHTDSPFQGTRRCCTPGNSQQLAGAPRTLVEN